MSERPEDRQRDRRRMGPLGDDEETRREPPRGEQEPTRQIPSRQRETGSGRTAREDDAGTGTRVMRTSDTRGGQEGAAYPSGYYEAMEEREQRLRDIYGGVDWLASFLGFVFTLVAGVVLAGIAGLVLVPLGFSVSFTGGALGPAAITGLVVVGVVLFLMYFFGGYVAGRLARFDGGLNGGMVVLWTVLAAMLLVLAGGIFSGFLPADISERLQGFIQGTARPTVDGLVQGGALGIGILVGAALMALLGGFLGGRVGGRYHTDIDYTL